MKYYKPLKIWTSKTEIGEMKNRKKSNKQDKLLKVAYTIPKISKFFTGKQKPPTTTPTSFNYLIVPME